MALIEFEVNSINDRDTAWIVKSKSTSTVQVKPYMSYNYAFHITLLENSVGVVNYVWCCMRAKFIFELTWIVLYAPLLQRVNNR